MAVTPLHLDRFAAEWRRLFDALEAQARALDAREAALREREAEVAAMAEELDEALREAHALSPIGRYAAHAATPDGSGAWVDPESLGPREVQVLAYIQEHCDAAGCYAEPPSAIRIALGERTGEVLGMGTVTAAITRMCHKGLLRRDPMRPHTIYLQARLQGGLNHEG